jgi:RHS repeat-associated protein
MIAIARALRRRQWVRASVVAVATIGVLLAVVAIRAIDVWITVASSYSQAILSDNPSVYYRLDETSGTTMADSSGAGRNGSYQSGMTYGISGALASDSDTAVAPNGNIAGTYSSGAGLPLGASARTVEGWIRTSDGGNQDLVSWGQAGTGQAFSLMIDNGGSRVRMTGYNDDVALTAPHPVSDGNWHLLDVSYDGNVTITAYLDGQSLGSATLSSALNTQAGALDVGGSVWCGCDPIRNNTNNGLDEVAVYPSALSATQIANHFTASGDTRPTVPGSVAATAGANQATVTWTASTATVPSGETAIAGYVVTAYNGSTAVNATSVPASAASATISGLRGSIAYTFQVYALNVFGNGAVGTSTSVTPSGSASTYASTVLSDGASFLYRVDDTGPLLTDSAGGHHSLAGSGMTRNIGGALVSDSDGGVAPNNNPAGIYNGGSGAPLGASARTVEGWVRTTDGGQQTLVSWGNGNGGQNFSLMVNNGGSSFGVATNGNDLWFTTPRPVNDGNWHLLDITYDGSVTATAYLDGQAVGSQQWGSPLNTGQGTLQVGALNWCTCNLIRNTNNGLDEVAVYPSALSATQIANHFTASGWALPTTPTAMVTWAGPASARVSWSSPTDTAVSYIITPVANDIPQTPITVPGDLTSVVVPGLTPGTLYKFQIVEHTQFGDSAPADPRIDPRPPLAATGEPTNIGVWVGYADGLRSGQFFPTPWPSTNQNDNGGILLTNTTGSDITVSAVTVNIGSYSASWGSGIVVPAGSYAFAIGGDSSDINGVGNCARSGLIPSISMTVGSHSVTYQDWAQVLNTGGWDQGSCPNLNEANKWELLGGPPTDPELLPNPSENAINCSTADPVNCATGDFHETFTDIAIPNRGVPLTLARTYNSLACASDGPLGSGWSFNGDMYLSRNTLMGTIDVHQETGATVTFSSTPTGFQAPPRVLATLMRNFDGTFTFTRKNQMRYTFDWRGELISEADRDGTTLTFVYSNGQLQSIADASGRSLTLTYTGGRVTRVADSAGRAVTYQYDNSGNLSQVTDVNGGVTKFTYDGSHLLLTKTDANGGVVTNVYDASGRVTSQTDPMNRTTTFQYQVGQTTVTDPTGNVTRSLYTNHELVQKTAGYGTPQAATWSYSYDPATLALTSITDPNGHVSTRTYDGQSNLLTSTDALSRRVSYTYDVFNDVLTTTDPMGVTTTFTYDSRGNLTQVSRPLLGTTQSQTTSYHRDDPSHPGDVTSVTDPAGKTSTFTYDAYGDQISSVDPVGDKTTAAYNSLGWVTSRVSPKGNVSGCGCAGQYTSMYSYADPYGGVVNQFGDMRVMTDPLMHATVRAYDANRNLVSLSDTNGNLTKYSYDADNELITVTRADGTTTSTDYNANGTVQDQKDGKGNAITTYGYDPLGRPIGVTDALGNVTRYGLDGVGNRVTRQDPGGNCTQSPPVGCTTMAYDAGNQLTSITYSDGVTPNVSAITYDADGQRTGMTDGTGTSTWTWDGLHRLTSYTNGAGATVSYDYRSPNGGYDLRNQVGHIAYPNGVGTVTRAYDSDGRLSSVMDWSGGTVTFSYDADSNLISQTTPSSPVVTDTYGFNATDQVSSVSDSNGSGTLFSASYARDGNGQVSSDSSLPSSVSSYRYTPLNQLCYAGGTVSQACSSPPTGSQAYAFDAADNLTGNHGTTQQFNAADELCWAVSGASNNGCASPPSGSSTFSYDGRGNLTSSLAANGIATCRTWDQADRLRAITNGGGASCASPTAVGAYAYSGDGLRQSKLVNGQTTQFAWDEAAALPLLLQEARAGVTTSYIYGPGGLPVEQISSSRPAITRVGTPTAAADLTGTAGALTLPLPSGTALGDQIIVATTYAAGLSNSVATPPGYTAVASVNSGGVSLTADVTQVFRKTAAPGDTSVSLSYRGIFPKAAVVVVYRNVDTAQPIDVTATGTNPSGTSLATSATTHFSNEQLVLIQGSSYVGTTGTWSAPSGTTERAQQDDTTLSVGLADASLPAAGGTGTLTSTFTTAGAFTVGPQLTNVLLTLQPPPLSLYYHHDQLGSTRLATDLQGATRATFTYDPSGNLTSDTGSPVEPLLFTGQYRDAESGLYYLRARYYDPLTEQFLSRDPLAENGRAPYAYVAGNPLNATDPFGLSPVLPQPTCEAPIGPICGPVHIQTVTTLGLDINAGTPGDPNLVRMGCDNPYFHGSLIGCGAAQAFASSEFSTCIDHFPSSGSAPFRALECEGSLYYFVYWQAYNALSQGDVDSTTHRQLVAGECYGLQGDIYVDNLEKRLDPSASGPFDETHYIIPLPGVHDDGSVDFIH